MPLQSLRERTPHVLVVEDEGVLRLTFVEFLTEEGYTVSEATSTADALYILAADHVDVVVSDIILGGNTGIELLRAIVKADLPCQTIMITGDPNLESATAAVRLGAFDYLPKPVTEHQLKRIVRLALERKRLEYERDHYRSELDAIFNSVNAGLFTVDPEMCLRQANRMARALFGFRAEDQGRPIHELLSQQAKAISTALKQSLESGQEVHDIHIELFPSGPDAHRVLSASTVPLVVGKQRREGAIAIIRDISRLTYLEERLKETTQFDKLIGKSAPMREIYQLVNDLAETDTTVLICGESGTGKELVAEAIHRSSTRSKKPFLKVNCAALSEDVLESELFGHVRGAFTGAVKDRVGRFEAANGGTLFLDEIGDISPRLQMRLLRVLQQGEFERVGDSRTIRSNVRIIAATNQELQEKIRAGEFRQDLYYRLNVVRIEIPPLRARIEDLPRLVEHFIRMFNAKMKKEITGVDPETLAIMMRCPWTGNVRELENCIERAYIVCRGPEILPEHLPSEILQDHPRPTIPSTAPDPPSGPAELNRDIILAVLTQTDWNVAKSARKLGIARNTLYQKIKHYNLTRPKNR